MNLGLWIRSIIAALITALYRWKEEQSWGGELIQLVLPLGEVVRAHISSPRASLREKDHLLVVYGYYLKLRSWEARVLRYYAQASAPLFYNKVVSQPAQNAAKTEAVKRMVEIYPTTLLSPDELYERLENLINVIGALGTMRVSATDLGIEFFDFAKNADSLRGPVRVDLAVTGIEDANGRRLCNADCGACYVKNSPLMKIGENDHVLTTDEWIRVIRILQANGVIQIVFTGGEPTTRPDLRELVDATRKNVTFLNTNGILLTKETGPNGQTLIEELVERGLDIVQITYYSVNKEIHEILVGKTNAHKRTEAGIKAAVATGVGVSINIPLCDLNAPTIVETLEHLRALDIRFVTLSGLIPAGGAVEMIQQAKQLSHDELLVVVTKAAEFGRNNGMRIDFTSPGQLTDEELINIGIQPPRCGAGILNMAVLPKGDLVACQSSTEEPDVIGMLLEHEWNTLWMSPVLREIRKRSLENFCPLINRVKEEEK